MFNIEFESMLENALYRGIFLDPSACICQFIKAVDTDCVPIYLDLIPGHYNFPLER